MVAASPAHEHGRDVMSTFQARDSGTAVDTAPPLTPDPEGVASADRMAHAAVFVSGFRCIMMYVLLPAAGPVVSQFNGVILPVNLLMHVITLVTTTLAVRRARRSNHPLRRLYMMLGAFFFLFSLVTMAFELLLVFGGPT
jgi:hypothetical protein